MVPLIQVELWLVCCERYLNNSLTRTGKQENYILGGTHLTRVQNAQCPNQIFWNCLFQPAFLPSAILKELSATEKGEDSSLRRLEIVNYFARLVPGACECGLSVGGYKEGP